MSLLLSIALLAYGGDPRLRIDPAQPRPGGKVTITYDPKTGPLEKSDTFVLDILSRERWCK
jgi:hypothetical protein